MIRLCTLASDECRDAEEAPSPAFGQKYGEARRCRGTAHELPAMTSQVDVHSTGLRRVVVRQECL